MRITKDTGQEASSCLERLVETAQTFIDAAATWADGESPDERREAPPPMEGAMGELPGLLSDALEVVK